MRENPNITRMKRVRARKEHKANLPNLIEEYKTLIEMVKVMKKQPQYADKKENMNRVLDTFSESLKKLKEELQWVGKKH